MLPSVVLNLTKLAGFPQVRRDFERHKKEATYCSVFSFLLIHGKWFFFVFLSFISSELIYGLKEK